MSTISIIPSHEIDFKKWDDCISQSTNNIIYAHSIYLNAMCDQWSGLIIDDYVSVMPIPWRKKMGISYCYTPAFIQQLGLFGKEKLLTDKIIGAIKDHFSFGDIMLNFENKITDDENIKLQTNLFIDLSIGHKSIQSDFKKDTLLNIKKSEKENLTYAISDEVNDIIQLYQSHYQSRTKHTTDKDYTQFINLSKQFYKTNNCLLRVIKKGGNIIAAVLLLKDDHRLYNIINVVTKEGRKREANYFLMNNIIQEFAGNNLLFDFEGSDLPGIKNFYEKFGAINQPYVHWRFNELPWFLKLIKK